MNRASFMRNMAGTLAAAIIGSKLEFLTPVDQVLNDVPGIGGQSFKLLIPRGCFRQYDVIQTQIGEQYMIKHVGNKIIAQHLHCDMQIELTETDLPHEPQAVRIMSALPETYDHSHSSASSSH